MKKRNEWDPITTATDGRVVWRRCGDRKIVVAKLGEPPNDALERQSTAKARSEPERRRRKP